jgi:hypothetical protein
MPNLPDSIQTKQGIARPICPNPPEWARLHTTALASAPDGDTFPKPLILAGWTFSSNVEKRQRWAETVEWLRERELEHLIESEVGGGWYHG